MNDTLKAFAKNEILEGLKNLPEKNQRTFKLMYATNNGKRKIEEVEAMTIEATVDEIPDDKLDWAMQQVINTHLKREKE